MRGQSNYFSFDGCDVEGGTAGEGAPSQEAVLGYQFSKKIASTVRVRVDLNGCSFYCLEGVLDAAALQPDTLKQAIHKKQILIRSISFKNKNVDNITVSASVVVIRRQQQQYINSSVKHHD
jgi:hypothetical protein